MSLPCKTAARNAAQRCRFLWTLTAVCWSMTITSISVRADDWPQWGGPQRDLCWRETGLVDELPRDEKGFLPRMWSTPIAEGYSGPSIAENRVFITDFAERVGNRGQERILCLDVETGKVNWSQQRDVQYTVSYPAGPRVTPTVDGDRVYTIGAMGHLDCLQVADGKILWSKNFERDFGTSLPVWGMASPPLIDGDQLITLVGGAKGATVVSFNKLTGQELWRAIDDPQVGYCPPVIYTFGKTRQLIIWTPSQVASLDPSNGKVYWTVPFEVKAGLTIPMPRQLGDRLFLTSFYNGPLMLQISDDPPAAKVLWRGNSNSETKTDKLHSIMPTPIVNEEQIFGVCSYGQLRALDTKTGERLWETLDATGSGRWWNAFLIPTGTPQNAERVFIHNEQGDLILARLDKAGYHEQSRSKLVEPTRPVNRRMTIWSHPAFAKQSVFARNDQEIVRVFLGKR